jgi:type II secretory pathway pseudopilin PulG
MHARDARGFSLMQLMVVVAIFTVVAAIAVPSFLTSSRTGRLRNDANALTNLIVMARMRASTEFARTRLNCTLTPASGPGYCQLQSLQFPGTGSWTNESQVVFLSPGVTFGIPAAITGYLPNQSTAAYQGDVTQNTPTTTTTPVIVFNSRGIAVDYSTGTTPTPGYALYITDSTSSYTGSYYAISVPLTGRPWQYRWNSASSTFVPTAVAGTAE